MHSLKRIVWNRIPLSYRYGALDLKYRFFGGTVKKYYSQFGEDIILQNIYSSKNDGFYVDVGAHHPKRYSNTYLLHKRGWKGINLDPYPKTIALFKRDRPDDINIHAAVAEEVGERPYYVFSDPAVNTLSETDAARWQKNKEITLITKMTVPVLPLRDILGQYLHRDQKIDVLNIDVEGIDMEVLKSNDWSMFQPQVVIIESHRFTIFAPNTDASYIFLNDLHYALYAVVGPSLIFVKDIS